MPTILVLTDKNTSLAATADATRDVQERLQASGVTWDVRSCREAFFAFEKSIGGVIRGHRWQDWTTHAVEAYAGFVRPYATVVGKGNADIIQAAMGRGKPVVFLPKHGRARSILGVGTRDAEAYVDGWQLVIGPEG
jgi:hypothetical protein